MMDELVRILQAGNHSLVVACDGKITCEQVDAIPCHTELSKEEVFDIINSLIQ